MNRSVNSEIVGVIVAIIGTTLFFGSAVLSLIYMFKHRGAKWRTLPAISIIALVLTGLVPESGWTDIRSQWHQAAMLLAWSIWALCLSLFFFKDKKEKTSWFLRVAFAVMGLVALFGSASGLVESWVFLHSF